MSATFPSGVIGHIVSMTRDYSGKEPRSVATCECGWTNSAPVASWRWLDRRIDAHWSAVVSKGAVAR